MGSTFTMFGLVCFVAAMGLLWVGAAISKEFSAASRQNAAATLGGLLVIVVIAVTILSWTGIVPFAVSYD